MRIKQIIFALSVLALTTGLLVEAKSLTESGERVSELEEANTNADLKQYHLPYNSISKSEYFVGASVPIAVPVVTTLLLDMSFPTFGIGHAIQGRYTSRGWIFTAGELFFLGSMVYFLSSLENRGLISFDTPIPIIANETLSKELGLRVSVFGLIGFMIWEAIDVWLLPSNIKVSNNRFELSPLYSMNNRVDRGYGGFGFSLKYKF